MEATGSDSLSFLLDKLPSELWYHHIFPYVIEDWLGVAKFWQVKAVKTAFSSPLASTTSRQQALYSTVALDDIELLDHIIACPYFEDIDESTIQRAIERAVMHNAKCLPLLTSCRKFDSLQDETISLAIRYNHLEALAHLLTLPIHFNNIYRVLTLAALHGRLDAIKAVMRSNVAQSEEDFAWNRIFDAAATYGQIHILKHIADAGLVTFYDSAMISAVEVNQLNAVEYLFQQLNVELTHPLLSVAVAHNSLEVLELLLNYGVEPAHEDLLDAIGRGHVTIVTSILKDGRVDPTLNNNEALQLAIDLNLNQVTKVLLADKRLKQEPLDPFLTNRTLCK